VVPYSHEITSCNRDVVLYLWQDHPARFSVTAQPERCHDIASWEVRWAADF